MFSRYSKSKLALFDDLIKDREAFINGAPWSIDSKDVRFKIGDTLADLKVPYHLGKTDEGLILAAIRSLCNILKGRYVQEDAHEAGQRKKVVLTLSSSSSSSSSDVSYKLLDTTYWLGVFKQNSLEKSLAREILLTTPLMDSAMLRHWLAPEGKGLDLFKWMISILEKALTDEIDVGSGEPTALMALLAIKAVIQKKKVLVKDLHIKGLSIERMDIATGFVLFATLNTALKTVFARFKKSEAIFMNPATEMALKSAIAPEAFLLIPSIVLSSSLNPYAIEEDTQEAVSKNMGPVKEWPENLVRFVESTVESCRNDKDALRIIWANCQSSNIRERIIAYLMEYDLPGTKGHDLFYDLYRDSRKRHLNDPKTLESLNSVIEGLKSRYDKDVDRGDKLRAFQGLIDEVKKGSPPTRGDINIITDKVRGVVVYKLDKYAERFIGLSSNALVDRRSDYSNERLIEEYKNGRLYRFSTDSRGIIHTLTVDTEGQLTVDMKDFTKKTLQLKEIAMADFMKVNFYEPILNAARKYETDPNLEGKGSSITLKGLPGDAAIFSGAVSSLISLSTDISNIGHEYREKVRAKFLPGLDKHMETIHEKNLNEESSIASRKEESDSPDNGSLISIGDEVNELIRDTTKDDLKAVISEDMEAGLFISYGVAAENIIITPKGRIDGESVRVAIGEKINEASRGTNRNQAVMHKLAKLFDKEKLSRGRDDLLFPFDIHIDRVYSIRISKELEEILEDDLREKTDINRSNLIEKLMDEYVNDLEKVRQHMAPSSLKVLNIDTHIYNRGHALSGQALKAYMKETRSKKFFFKKELSVSGLGQKIQDKFFFPRKQLELWFSVDQKDKVEIFSKVGSITFKGFESSPPTEVYEILNIEGPFYKALLAEHFTLWREEAKTAAREVHFASPKP